MAPKVTDKERADIALLLREHNGNQSKVARLSGRSQPTVRLIAIETGISSINCAPKKANDARVAYAEDRRLEIIGKGFDKANDLLKGITDAAELQKWSVALGTLVDKARLETGQATDRTESVDPERRKRIHGTVDELDVLRRLRSSNTG